MSRKRKKQQRELEKLVEGMLMICLCAAFFGMYHLSKSLLAGGITAGIVLGIYIFIVMYRNAVQQGKLRRSGIKEIDEMDGRQFERYLGHLLKSHGYDIQVTRASGDYGADLVISKEGKKVVVQAKRYSKTVGLKAVQEVKAAIAHYGASEGWVMANRDYSDEAYSLARSNGVRLINREELIEMILKVNPGVT